MSRNFEASFFVDRPADHRQRGKPRRGRSRSSGRLGSRDGGFQCAHCNYFVCAEPFVSGVQNRNHCPYCLWSRHLDLDRPGDRLAACKGPMEPVGLTLKRTRNKYGSGICGGTWSGELMLIHRCVECGRLSINRIAADDDPETIYEVFEASLEASQRLAARQAEEGIQALGAGDIEIVRARLFGWSALSDELWEAGTLVEVFEHD